MRLTRTGTVLKDYKATRVPLASGQAVLVRAVQVKSIDPSTVGEP